MRHGQRIAAAWLQGLAEMLFAFPVLAAVYIAVPGWTLSAPLWLAALSLAYALGYAFHRAFPAVRHWQSVLAAVAVPALGAWLMAGSAVAVGANFALALVAWVRGRQNRLYGWDRSFVPGIAWIGMIGYFLASFFYPRFDVTAPFAPWVTGFGIGALALALYRTNGSTLDKESLSTDAASKPRLSGETKWRNRALVFALFALILALAAFRTIASAVKEAALFVFGGVYALLLQLFNLFGSGPVGPEPASPPPQDLGPLFEPAKPSAFAKVMENIMYGAVIVLLAAAAIALLYVGGKYVRRWLKRLMGWYGERLESGLEAGYLDEKQSLMDGREWARERAEAWKRRFADLFRKEPGWDDLADNRERVRHAYRRLLLGRMAGGYAHDEARTPRETGRELERRTPLGPDEAAALRLYEDARYGGKAVSDEQAAAVKPLFRSGGGKRG
nr:DUF4129 domain-containing protein [Paenibacillus flagellatus]